MKLEQADQIIKLVNQFVPEATVYMVNPYKYGDRWHDDSYAIKFGLFNVEISNFTLAVDYYGRMVGYDDTAIFGHTG
ncbi:hypothetical protein [Weissella cibaria]|jgi:hypothetical protein|uniref:hypothetical protein n=1 Tax=Weissella cibaria TaxID=137591 RepID=UPI001C1FBB3F|nr:hypothetical protein [Weissella cibaria]MBU7544304.1 hypothetical protein [Weissella cibaria]MCV3317412.1 hypothetical protein [Weissella cibaria]